MLSAHHSAGAVSGRFASSGVVAVTGCGEGIHPPPLPLQPSIGRHFMRRFMFTVLSLLAVSGFAQQPNVSEKVDVNLVLIDATVTDVTGHHILGLDKNDFVVTENGKPVAVDTVDYFTN